MYGEIEEEVNFKISEGFEKEYQENFVYKFNKVLNGLKQVPRLWNNTWIFKFTSFIQLKTDTSIFMKNFLIEAIYIEDFVINNEETEKEVT